MLEEVPVLGEAPVWRRSPISFAVTLGPSAALQWSEVEGASGYVLERSEDKSFLNPSEVYEGEDRRTTDLWPIVTPDIHRLMSRLRRFQYRVRAKGGVAFEDSPWSNVVTVEESPPPKQA